MTDTTAKPPYAKAGEPDTEPSASTDAKRDPRTDNPLRTEDGLGIRQPAGPVQPSVKDHQGVARHVSVGVEDGWEPAPIDPDDKAVEAAKKRNDEQEERLDAAGLGRVDPVSGQILTGKDKETSKSKASS